MSTRMLRISKVPTFSDLVAKCKLKLSVIRSDSVAVGVLCRLGYGQAENIAWTLCLAEFPIR
jgi:hypothetical protein